MVPCKNKNWYLVFGHGCDTTDSQMSPQPQLRLGCGDIWESVVSQPWTKTRYQFLQPQWCLQLNGQWRSLRWFSSNNFSANVVGIPFVQNCTHVCFLPGVSGNRLYLWALFKIDLHFRALWYISRQSELWLDLQIRVVYGHPKNCIHNSCFVEIFWGFAPTNLTCVGGFGVYFLGGGHFKQYG